MQKPCGDSAKAEALLLSPEVPFPAVGGGALRTASIFEYLADRYVLDVITFRQPGAADPRLAFPVGRARSVSVVDLPRNGRSIGARVVRNAVRAMRGRPPLLDRFSGFEAGIADALRGRLYAVGLIEHFWCAGYADLLRPHCGRLVLDLHNIESEWHATLAGTEGWAARWPHTRFASAYRKLERELLPAFDTVLVTSKVDARRTGRQCIVYPNALPWVPRPEKGKREAIVFTGNLEYQPNRSAILFFRDRIWPTLRGRWPGLTWEIAGKNASAVRGLVADDPRIRLVDGIEDAVRFIASAKVAVVPLLSGSGTRIKILEAWAAGTPVVSTRLGAEGLEFTAGSHLILADSASDFSEAVSELLGNADHREAIGLAGRTLYALKYTWGKAWETLDETPDFRGAS